MTVTAIGGTTCVSDYRLTRNASAVDIDYDADPVFYNAYVNFVDPQTGFIVSDFYFNILDDYDGVTVTKRYYAAGHRINLYHLRKDHTYTVYISEDDMPVGYKYGGYSRELEYTINPRIETACDFAIFADHPQEVIVTTTTAVSSPSTVTTTVNNTEAPPVTTQTTNKYQANKGFYTVPAAKCANPSTATMRVGDVQELTISAYYMTNEDFVFEVPKGSPPYFLLSFTSDNEDVATVDEEGTIVAVSPGTANILINQEDRYGYFEDTGKTKNIAVPIQVIENNYPVTTTVRTTYPPDDIPFTTYPTTTYIMNTTTKATSTHIPETTTIAYGTGNCYPTTTQTKGTYSTSEICTETTAPTETTKSFYDCSNMRIGETRVIKAKNKFELVESYIDSAEVVWDKEHPETITVKALKKGSAGILVSESLSEHLYSEINIEIVEAKVGDANTDGEVSPADAVTILQYLGNKDKYNLSSEAVKYADVYNPGDGITAMDALTIQKLDAGVIDSLPVYES